MTSMVRSRSSHLPSDFPLMLVIVAVASMM
jgi:hypothetical protein